MTAVEEVLNALKPQAQPRKRRRVILIYPDYILRERQAQEDRERFDRETHPHNKRYYA